MKCPKCGYESTVLEAAASPEICPKCSVVYAKVMAQRSETTRSNTGMTTRQAKEEWRKEKALNSPPRMVVTDFDIPFGRLVWLMTKIILAALPAAVLASLIVAMLGVLFAGLFGGLVSS